MTPELRAQMASIRQEAGLSKRRLAKKIGVTPAALTHWDQGANDPSITTLEKYVEACGARLILAAGELGDAAAVLYAVPQDRREMALRFARALSRARVESLATVNAFLDFVDQAAGEGEHQPVPGHNGLQGRDGLPQLPRGGRVK